MPIHEFTKEEIRSLEKTTFSGMQLQESDLQRLLRAKISVIAPDTLVISEEFGNWDESRRRIDLLAVDRDANLVVIEIKRTEDGGHMDLQAIRYASMVSTMTFEQVVAEFGRYLESIGDNKADARARLLDFLKLKESDEDTFAQDVRIILASAEFSRELTTSVLWLIDKGVDIRCVRLQPYAFDDRVFVDAQQIIPLPETDDYRVKVIEKRRKERLARSDHRDMRRYDVSIGGRRLPKLPKRRMVYETFLHLVMESGIDPEDISELCDWPDSMLYYVDGNVEETEFIRQLTEKRMMQNRSFDSDQYFCRKGEAILFGQRTYVLYKKWKTKEAMQAMQRLREAFPDQNIDFQPSE